MSITDAVGSVGFHPLRPLMLSVSGSRHYHEGNGSDSSSSDSESTSSSDGEDNTGSGAEETLIRRPRQRPAPGVKEASIKLWDFQSPTHEDMAPP